jgi:D-alanyl-D-alanine carboxypeptidase
MKTGFVCDSGFNLVASATRNNRKLISVVLGAKSGYARALLSKNMLENGFNALSNSAAPKVSTLVNEAFGQKPITDMTPQVCRRKEVAELIEPSALSGWGVSFGLHESPEAADATLHASLLKPAGRLAMGFGATYRAQDKDGFMPVLWGMGRGDAEKTCEGYRSSGTACAVIPDFLFKLYGDMYLSRIQAQKDAKGVKTNAAPQGSDNGASGKPKFKKKAVQKKSRRAKKAER